MNKLREISLDDKYTCASGPVLVTGMQAIARVLMEQQRRDSDFGLNTAGFISGYRGSPLGTLDSALWSAKQSLDQHNIVFQPGVNEELAATAVLGSQQTAYYKDPKFDGVFGAWYGKGPGVDRAGDALKHGNLAGAAKNGGVLVIAGDDHPGKSSTTCHQSEQALAASMIPVLYPANVEEYLRFGIFGYAMSRFSGAWIGFKCVNDTADATATARLETMARQFAIPDVALPPEGLNLILGDSRFAQESRTVDFRLPAATAFARANCIDQALLSSPKPRLGIISAGKAALDVLEALNQLGISKQRASELGLCVLKLGLTWPADTELLRSFSSGLREVLVVEEKRAFIETQVKDALYGLPADLRPVITGKTAENGAPLIASYGELNAFSLIPNIFSRLQSNDMAPSEISEKAAAILAKGPNDTNDNATELARTPFYCSGCPHNTSTKVPDDATALAGIGCHVMAAMMPHRKHIWPVQMGGEGANWIGAAPFVSTKHVFQNLGDGTYFHSGLLAIRAAISAGSNITYKLLYNDAVAMTGGQPVEGQLTVPQIVGQLLNEGVARVEVVAEDPSIYTQLPPLPSQMQVHPRDQFEAVQGSLAKEQGVTVLIYDQVCAAEKRRRRKRGLLPDPSRRVMINTGVCEGCGDCGAKSNCVSIQPVETEFGRKRRIDQSSCNKDFSCLKGFCPSFVTIEGGQLAAIQGDQTIDIPDLPRPSLVDDNQPVSIMIAGVGGTGVVTIGALIAMAAHLEGKAASILDMTGLSQKNGAVYSHLRIAAEPEHIHAAQIGKRAADVLLGCDLVAAATGDAMATIRSGETAMVLNDNMTATPAFTFTPDLDLQSDRVLGKLIDRSDHKRSVTLDASGLARKIMGDSIGANMMIVGAACQNGLLPVTVDAIEAAIRLNNVAVELNLKAFSLGRWFAVEPEQVQCIVDGEETKPSDVASRDPMQARVAELTAYQSQQYARRFEDVVSRARKAEFDAGIMGDSYSAAVIRYAYKVMAYKDEYEVARLYTDGRFARQLKDEFSGHYTLRFHMAPPLITRKDPRTGEPRKIALGQWMWPILRVLKTLRGLRGSPFDPFGYTEERRQERSIRDEYLQMIDTVSANLTRDNCQLAVALASYPEQIRGYGHIKAQHIVKAAAERDEMFAKFSLAAAEQQETRKTVLPAEVG